MIKNIEMDYNELLDNCAKLIKNSNELLDELKEMREGVDFLVNKYRTNKRYFCSEGSSPSVDDVIKTTFEFAWAQAKLRFNTNQEGGEE